MMKILFLILALISPHAKSSSDCEDLVNTLTGYRLGPIEKSRISALPGYKLDESRSTRETPLNGYLEFFFTTASNPFDAIEALNAHKISVSYYKESIISISISRTGKKEDVQSFYNKKISPTEAISGVSVSNKYKNDYRSSTRLFCKNDFSFTYDLIEIDRSQNIYLASATFENIALKNQWMGDYLRAYCQTKKKEERDSDPCKSMPR